MSDLVADRLAEAAQIESEWNAMSYKDRAAWWMSAKWYGYMPADAYRRGDPINLDISCRYGEPGFFIATRVPYFEAQAAVAEVVATTTESPVSAAEPEATPTPTPTSTTTPPTEPVSEPVAEDITATNQAANILREAIKNSVSETTTILAAATTAAITTQPSNTNTHHKKKKKNKRGASTGAGKTIEISLGH